MENWFKKHVDTVIVLGGILTSVIWMNSKFNEIDHRFSSLENRLTTIEAVMIVKGIMPKELVTNNKEKKIEPIQKNKEE